MENSLTAVAKNVLTSTELSKLQEVNKLAKNTEQSYQNDIDLFFHFCSERIVKPSVSSLFAYIGYLLDQDYKISTIRRKYASISKLYTLTAEDRKNFNTTLRGIAKEQVTREDKKVKQAVAISEYKLNRLVEAIGFHSANHICNIAKVRRDCIMLLLSFYGGLRGSELLNIKKEDISIDNNILTITLHATKTAIQDKVFIYNDRVIKKVCNYLATKGNGYLFTKIDKHGTITKQPISRQAWTKIIKQYNEQYNLNLQTHSFRRGAITEIVSKGANIIEGMNFSRHKSKVSYLRYIDSKDRQEVNGGKLLQN